MNSDTGDRSAEAGAGVLLWGLRIFAAALLVVGFWGLLGLKRIESGAGGEPIAIPGDIPGSVLAGLACWTVGFFLSIVVWWGAVRRGVERISERFEQGGGGGEGGPEIIVKARENPADGGGAREDRG